MLKTATHVVVLMGGLSREREVSLMSGKAVSTALTRLGYRTTSLDMGHDLAEKLVALKPDIVFNALHGTYGEDGCVAGLLEILNMPYTHSGVLASAMAMQKDIAKNILMGNSILCPDGVTATAEAILSGADVIPRPYVIKPVSEGSSVGTYLILEEDTPLPHKDALQIYNHLLVEQYIPGKELSVACLDSGPLGVIELRPKVGFYDYTNKYTDNKTSHIMPAAIDKITAQKAQEIAFKAHKLLGCRGVSRCDFRYDDEGDGKLYLLELNTHPGLTPLSLVPEIAAYSGMGFEDLVQYLVNQARCDNDQKTKKK